MEKDNSNCPNIGNRNTNSTSCAQPSIFVWLWMEVRTPDLEDTMNECSNPPYLSTNVTGAIKHFTSLQQVNDCDSGYD
ncbi:MAG: hypothetical protein WAM42_10860 [Candidatus Nitrosopolaris sp.]